tara:strand:+ start:14147 stop:15967 length:1821 start_codon:yes stop_codon:yes gene_type:complete
LQNNLISAIAGWKSAALLAIVALVATVAFSGVLTSTKTAEAATVTLAAGATTVDAAPGDTVLIQGGNPDGSGGVNNVAIMNYAIGASSTASGSFNSGGGQSLSCSDSTTGLACDQATAANVVSVKLDIPATSADGYIIVTRTVILPVGGTNDTVVITVTTQPAPASMTATASAATISAAVGTTSTITANVKNNAATPVGMNGQTLTVSTNLGTISCPETTSGGVTIAAATNVQLCQLYTTNTGGADGNAVITLTGQGVGGTATVTITHGTLGSVTSAVVMYGAAANVASSISQSSVEIGGSVYVTLTVTDAAGNAVAGALPVAAAANAIVAPSTAAGTNAVTTSFTANLDVDDDGVVDAGVDIPSCTAHTDGGEFASTGTDANGQCVVKVTAPADNAGTAADEAATRGTNTLNFALGTLTASANVTVAGAAASFTSDAPANVDALSDTTITVTVLDDEGVLVGATAINVIIVAGDGIAEGAATLANATTVNGASTFTYAAGLSGSNVVFRVIAGTGATAVRGTISVAIGAPAVAQTWSATLVSGTHNLVWLGADAADPSTASTGVSAIWQWNGTGWDGYFPSAAGVPGGNTLTSLSNGSAYWVIVD